MEKTKVRILSQKLKYDPYISWEEESTYLKIMYGTENTGLIPIFEKPMHLLSQEEHRIRCELLYGREVMIIQDKITRKEQISLEEFSIYTTRYKTKLASHQVKWYAYEDSIARQYCIILPEERGSDAYFEVLKEANLLEVNQGMGVAYMARYHGNHAAQLYQKWLNSLLPINRSFFDRIRNSWKTPSDEISQEEKQELYSIRYGERAWQLLNQNEKTREEQDEWILLTRGKKALSVFQQHRYKTGIDSRVVDFDYEVLVRGEIIYKLIADEMMNHAHEERRRTGST